MSLDVIQQVEEKTIDSKKVGSLLILSCKKLLLDLGKYIYRFKIGFESTSKGTKICFGCQPNG